MMEETRVDQKSYESTSTNAKQMNLFHDHQLPSESPAQVTQIQTNVL